MLQIASWASRRSGQTWTFVVAGNAVTMDGKAFMAVWMVRVMGEMRIRSRVVGRVICLVVACPAGVRAGSRWG